jgi:hypothetical protein
MAAVKGRRRARKPRPEDRLDDLSFKIESVKRRWSRGPRWDSTMRRQVGIESSDQLEIAGVTCQPNALEFDRVHLTIHSRSGDEMDAGEFLGLCDRMRGDRGLLIAYLWAPPQDILALGPPLLERQFVELELRVRGFFRNKGRIQSMGLHTQMTAYEDWLVEAQEQGWPGEVAGSKRLTE